MTYRNELDQAHRRIEQLEEELRLEREKNEPKPIESKSVEALNPAPEPIIRLPPKRALPRLAWWPVPSAALAAIVYLVWFGFAIPAEPAAAIIVGSAFAASAMMSIDAVLRWRNGGERTLLGRIAIVFAVILGVPFLITALAIGAPLGGIVSAIGAAIMGIVALVRWIVKGDDH